jgi:xanthine/CO dehydrogenase XdhC/CoxF family maturation factor
MSVELASIVQESRALRTYLLATVVRVVGSSYRRPGARMLVAQDRWLAGCVSGGCLEGDLLRRGEFLLRGGAPVLVRYDSTSDDEVGWGAGLGCNGVIEILLERIDKTTRIDPLRFVESCFAAEEEGLLVTVSESDDSAIPVGARLAVRSGEVVAMSHPGVEPLLDGPIDGVSALVESIVPPPRVFVVGSGHDALPVVEAVRSMGWGVTVVDAHARFATRERFGDEILIGDARALGDAVARPHRAYAVLMTHDYERDRAYLAALLASPARYVGVLGPYGRTSRMLAEIAREMLLDDAMLARLHAPIGLDIGAETPREIALAIVAEIQASLTAAPAGRLRGRSMPIHDEAVREEEEATS